jgi:molybdenum cofactor cytidylyltransferase
MTLRQPGAVVLAGGDGTRIGIPKLMLRAGNESFLARITRVLREADVTPVTVVATRHHDAFVQEAASEALFVAIEDPNAPMLISLKAGLAALTIPRPILVVPVDHPFVGSATIRAIIECARSNDASVVKPRYRERAGHPIFIPEQLIPLILDADNTSTLRDIIRNANIPQQFADLDDPGILRNINTRRDLEDDPT